ncbi:MAG: ammonium transporter [Opitutales bacterium]|nr:ammonium transporter [Opitutales bacterium]
MKRFIGLLNNRGSTPWKLGLLGLALLFASASPAWAQNASAPEAPAEEVKSDEAAPSESSEPNTYNYDAVDQKRTPFFTTSNLWLLLAAGLVFIMHLGFATLESGLCRAKNTTNVLFKNVWIISAGVLSYALWGFNSMYPGDMITEETPEGDWNGYFAAGSWFGNPESTQEEIDTWNNEQLSSDYADYNWWTDFIFQAMFAATGATIVSGAVAERVKLGSFMLFAVLLVMFAYPISGAWKWGGGFLDNDGFYDFAGSSVVHAFGGFAALACVLVLGPRKGKFTSDGKIKPIPAHNFPLATIGVFLLFLGWFGFNGGSVLNADPLLVAHVFVTTTLAACAGAAASIGVSWFALKKPDLSMALNGVLAGLVGITAGADTVGMGSAIVIGLIAGSIVVYAIVTFDKLKIDDPVGAISVHGVCGIWGTVAVGIFSFNPEHTFGTQLKGTLIISAWAFVFSYVAFSAIKAVMGVRVSEEEEEQGLDLAEHGQEAYADFQTKTS